LDDFANITRACYHCTVTKAPMSRRLTGNRTDDAAIQFARRRVAGTFSAVGAVVTGRTPIGRATSRPFNPNSELENREIRKTREPEKEISVLIPTEIFSTPPAVAVP